MTEKTKAQTATEHMMTMINNPLISINDWECQFLTEDVEEYQDEMGGCRAMTGEVIFKVYLTNSVIKKRFEEIKARAGLDESNQGIGKGEESNGEEKDGGRETGAAGEPSSD